VWPTAALRVARTDQDGDATLAELPGGLEADAPIAAGDQRDRALRTRGLGNV
jgi:hypothetical protein